MENLRYHSQIFAFLAVPVGHDTYVARARSQADMRDYWKRTGNVLTRVHVQPRRSLFVPGVTCPVPLCQLLPSRETTVSQQNVQHQLYRDVWNDANSARCLAHSWIGETRFVVSSK